MAAAAICCPAIRHGLRLESINAFSRSDGNRNGSAPAGAADDLGACTSRAHYASGFRPIVPADFNYGIGGLLAATGDLYADYFGDMDIVDVIDAALTLPITQLAVAEGRK
ncbi:hypothetical protein [Paraburkholderia sp. BL23I1N1]|uniref:hypothetical protein n=1 Tax=Paraburkholderia sp. BL23I1N1 TaxID=1938802 RepID=UPI0011C484B9|nr:hypothetical protein [Paraburkholderia sp. BL23I1N1]